MDAVGRHLIRLALVSMHVAPSLTQPPASTSPGLTWSTMTSAATTQADDETAPDTPDTGYMTNSRVILFVGTVTSIAVVCSIALVISAVKGTRRSERRGGGFSFFSRVARFRPAQAGVIVPPVTYSRTTAGVSSPGPRADAHEDERDPLLAAP